MKKMKLVVLLVLTLIQFSEEKPTFLDTTTTGNQPDNESSTITNDELWVTLGPEPTAKSISLTEKVVKNSSDADNPPKDIQLPVDLLSEDILLDPSVILARAERSAEDLKDSDLIGPIGDPSNIVKFVDGVPTFYFVRFVRVPRSVFDSKLEPEKNEPLRIPEEWDKNLKRFSRSAEDDEARDLHGADDGFIVRPLFKYRHEQSKKYHRRGFRNRDIYNFYPRYPILPGK